MPLTYDPYQGPKTMGIFKEIPSHSYKDVNAGTIVQRITRSREMYEARQRAKGIKAQTEEAHRAREILEEEQRAREEQRAKAV